MSPIAVTVWLGVATVSIAWTIGKTPVFDPVKRHLPAALAEPMSCPYCLAHWIGAALALWFRPEPFTGTAIDLIPVTFIIVTVAMLITLVVGILIAVEAAIMGGE